MLVKSLNAYVLACSSATQEAKECAARPRQTPYGRMGADESESDTDTEGDQQCTPWWELWENRVWEVRIV